MASNRFPLTLLTGSFAVCKLGPDDEAPAWILDAGGPLACVMRTGDELCVVCAETDVPDNALQVERGWRAFKLEGPVPFTTVGVVSSLTAPLAEAGIGVFILSTYDTDYLLVKGESAARAQKVLTRAGFVVAPQPAP
jgi:hypothetical protein